MSYASVDALQKTLSETVFGYAIDKKKASGRALGTLIEIITYYTLKSWGFRDSIAIERPLSEFANPAITHNVEYSLHPIVGNHQQNLGRVVLPMSSAKLRKALAAIVGEDGTDKANVLFTSDRIIRNACTIYDNPEGSVVVHLDEYAEDKFLVSVSLLSGHPYAIFECKRVGIEEGMKKGPQTIEKAKQGAYVARSVSSLQKVRLRDGKFAGIIQRRDGSLYHKPYEELVQEIIESNDPDLLRGFILTVGVVSNHGNWFSRENQNKELKVLAQSYDWLLFLTDQGLSEFVDELLLNPTKELAAAKKAFLASYSGEKGKNRFTKVQMDADADMVLQRYFVKHSARVMDWFNVITPARGTLPLLHKELKLLRDKDWKTILGT